MAQTAQVKASPAKASPAKASPVKVAPARRRSDAKEERPKEIVAAALAEFAQSGFAGTRLDDVADRAGISKGTIYLYFPTKEDLFKEAVRETLGRHVAEMAAEAAVYEGGMADLLRGIIATSAGLLTKTEYRTILILMIGEGKRFPELVDFYFGEVIKPGITALKGILERGIARGEFRPGPAREVPQVLFGSVMMAAVWTHLFSDRAPMDINKMVDAHLDTILNGLLVDRDQSA